MRSLTCLLVAAAALAPIPARAVVGGEPGPELGGSVGHSPVGDEHLLITDATDLEPLRTVTNFLEIDPVVAFTVEENDVVATVLVGLGGLGDAALIRRRFDVYVAQRGRVGGDDPPANDIGLLRVSSGDKRAERNCNDGQPHH